MGGAALCVEAEDPLARRTITVRDDDVPLVADIVGRPEDPPVVLLHGGGQTRGSWKRTLEVVAARGFQALAYDSRGHGDSGWSADGDYSLEAFARNLGAVLALFEQPAVVVGASMGGLTALTYLGSDVRRPVRALALIDVAPRVNMQGAERIVAFMRSNPDGFAGVAEAADAVAAYQPHRQRPTSTVGLERNLRFRDGRYYWHWDPRLLDARHVDDDDLARLDRAAQAVQVPTLLIHAEHSDLVTKDGIAHLREVIPHCDYVTVPGASHMVAGDANDTFNAAILRFLDEVRDVPDAGLTLGNGRDK